MAEEKKNIFQLILEFINKVNSQPTTGSESWYDMIQHMDEEKFNSLSQGQREMWLRASGALAGFGALADIFISGSASQLKNALTMAKYSSDLNKIKSMYVSKKLTPAEVAKGAGKVAAALALYYQLDELAEKGRQIPVVDKIIKYGQVGPMILQTYVDGAIPVLGKWTNSLKRKGFEWWSGILDWIGLDNSAQTLRDYVEWYDNNNMSEYGWTLSDLKTMSMANNTKKKKQLEDAIRNQRPSTVKEFVDMARFVPAKYWPDSLVKALKAANAFKDVENVNLFSIGVNSYGDTKEKAYPGIKVIQSWLDEQNSKPIDLTPQAMQLPGMRQVVTYVNQLNSKNQK